ncbi:UNVERIFIED_CONTAM: hypothetical protein FKN15_075666 [Acipenser sinensis]
MCVLYVYCPLSAENLERILEISKLRAIQRKARFAKLKICVYKEEMPVTPYERPLFNSLRFERGQAVRAPLRGGRVLRTLGGRGRRVRPAALHRQRPGHAGHQCRPPVHRGV